MDQLWIWIAFNLFVLAMLAVDLLVFHREAHEVSLKEAASWSIVWVAVALALVFGAGVYVRLGTEPGLQYLTGYLLVDIYKVPVGLSLAVIAILLASSVVASLIWPKAAEAHDPVTHDPLEPAPPDPVRSPPLEPRP